MQDITLDDKTSLILALIKMANADESVHHFEQMNISLLTTTLGVDPNKVAELRKNIESLPIIPPKSKKEKLEYFWRILTMMKMDMHADERELLLCKELGLGLQLSQFEVTHLMAYMAERLNQFVPFDEFLEFAESLDKHPENVKSTSFLEKLISLFR
jgi:hypothetical protein